MSSWKSWIRDLPRWPCLWIYQALGRFERLVARTDVTIIGFSGHVSLIDRAIAKERGLQPLTRFERWLVKPYVEFETRRRRQAWRQAVIDVTGEDPEVDWL